MSEQIERDDCYICGRGHGDILERHHIVPRRFGGTDSADNLVDLCPSCHRALEKLYGTRFYEQLGITTKSEQETQVSGVCGFEDCQADAEHLVGGVGVDMKCCDDHKECCMNNCDRRSVSTVMSNGGAIVCCDQHRECTKNGCKSKETKIYRAPLGFDYTHKPFCETHGESATILGDDFKRSWE